MDFNHFSPVGVFPLEREFQNGKLAILADPQYRLVLRGQSFKTGEEVVELQVYNQSRGIYEKVSAKVTLEEGITLDDLRTGLKKVGVHTNENQL